MEGRESGEGDLQVLISSRSDLFSFMYDLDLHVLLSFFYSFCSGNDSTIRYDTLSFLFFYFLIVHGRHGNGCWTHCVD